MKMKTSKLSISIALAVLVVGSGCQRGSGAASEKNQVAALSTKDTDKSAAALDRTTKLPSGTFDLVNNYRADDVAVSTVHAEMSAYDLSECEKYRKGDFSKLSAEEIYSIRQYTNSDYYDMNLGLRNSDAELLGKWQNRIKLAASGLNKLPPYRGWVKRRATLPTETVEQIRSATQYNPKTFFSATKSLTADVYVLGKFLGLAKFQGLESFHLNSLTGHDISRISYHPEEQEVLFAPGATFKVTKVEKAPNEYIFWTFKMDEVQ